jgi:hypothetical protein
MDDRIRVSDADRDRVAARLRDHFAAGRLTHDELDQRVSAALNAKTFGDLRHVMTDLPEPVSLPPRAERRPWLAAPGAVRRRGPRILPLMLFALLAAVLIPGGGWLLFAFFMVVLVVWLVAWLAGVLAVGRFRRRMHHDWQSGSAEYEPRRPHW